MYQLRSAILSLVLLGLAGCGESGPGNEVDPQAAASGLGPSTAESTTHHAAHDRLGPVEYTYDEKQLTRADIQLGLPPSYDQDVWATKFIPADRAVNLGEETCSYGESGIMQTCTAEKEPGLALSLLARPIDDYRYSFEEQGVPDEELEPARVDDAEGFSFTAQAEGSGIEYSFVPVGERTLLIARSISTMAGSGSAAIASVLASLDLGG